VSVVQSERRFEWPFPIGDTITCKVHPFIFAKLFHDPRNARFLFLCASECNGGVKELTNVCQFCAYGMELRHILASGVRLTDRKETFRLGCRTGGIALSSANQGGEDDEMYISASLR
jgi:hypothetical protein